MTSDCTAPGGAEGARLAALARYEVLDTEPEPAFDDLTRLAAAVCRTPIALVSLLDDDRQWFKSRVGLDVCSTARDIAFCDHVVRSREPLIVPDTWADPRFSTNPLVTGPSAFRFYAGAPLLSGDGHVLGTLCVLDTVPRILTAEQLALLQALARQAMTQLESRRHNLALAAEVARRERAQTDLAEVAEQARGVVESCADALVAIDEHGTVVDWNPAAEQTFGWSSAEAVGQPLAELIIPRELREQHEAGLSRLREGGPTRILGQRGLQLVGQRRDGTRLPIELTVWRSRWADGWRFNAFLRDVSEPARAAQALAVLREEADRRAGFTAAVLETLDVGVVACDESGNITLSNSAARSLYAIEGPGVRPDQWAVRYGLFQEDGTTPLAPDEVPLLRALTAGRVDDATIVIRPAGEPARTLRCDGRALHDDLGRLGGAVLAMTDVTAARARARELEGARDQALAATRAKTAFLAAASHEIRTPLNGLLGTLELLSLMTLTARQAEYVAVARASGGTLLRLLSDVLDLSKAEATTVVLLEEPFRPGGAAADVVHALAQVAQRKGLTLTLESDDDPLVVGDAGRVRQVLTNLLGNALKFTASGSVCVRVDAVPAADPERLLVRLSVRDSGVGMEQDEVARLFQPFVQGAQGQRYGGTGLGLALTQQIVDLMGGSVQVVSTPGQGSTFTVEVELPRAQHPGALAVRGADPAGGQVADGQPVSVPAPREAGTGPRRLRVLLADDTAVNVMVLQALLETLGAEVVTVDDGDLAVAAVQEEAFDLVLLDNQMPRMTGVEAAAAIRALPTAAGRVRLVAVTAGTSPEDAAAFAAVGVRPVLTKPVSREQLRQVLAGIRAETSAPA